MVINKLPRSSSRAVYYITDPLQPCSDLEHRVHDCLGNIAVIIEITFPWINITNSTQTGIDNDIWGIFS